MIHKLAAASLCALMWACISPLPVHSDELNDGAQRGSGPISVAVFYATNRAPPADELLASDYGNARGVPRFGRCRVDFTPISGMSRIAERLPFYLPRETNELGAVVQEDPEYFWAQVQRAVAASDSESLILFIHGYNYGFARTCRMAAELQRDLGTGAALVMLSWPANGMPMEYAQDLADVEWSLPFLADVLAQAGVRVGAERIQLVAHSLGARGATLALQRLRADRGETQLVRHLVLLAPDLDAQTFVESLPRIQSTTASITLYASDKDAPLKLSHRLSGYPRLGQGGELLTVVDGIESIDVSELGRYQIFGHEYFFYHPLVAADLVELLVTGRRAADRSGLATANKAGRTYWRMRPEKTH